MCEAGWNYLRGFVAKGMRRCNRGRVDSPEGGQGKVPVYDLINCGPKRAFTVIGCDGEPLLVHNCWTFSPKEFPDAPNRPFILWDYQEEAVKKLNAAIGNHDLLIEKSRDMGASWICLSVLLWRWMFRDRQTFLVGSRKQELVDRTGDPKSLFWKMRYLLENLPGWMAPRYTDTSMHLLNEENGSTIDGESTNDDFARGDRRNAILLDEFPAVVDNGHNILAATRDATSCRIFNGTPQGASGAYFDTREKYMREQPDWVLRMHWTRHPMKNKGLYRTIDGKPHTKIHVVDKQYKFPNDYHFIDDGKDRSPWYDAQCLRAAHVQEIAQELDIDYAASGFQYFDPKVLEELIRETARPPVYLGDLTYESKGLDPKFSIELKGRLQVWCPLDGQGRPPLAEYWIGCDIATGKGGELSSNSVASVADRKTGQKVAQFTCNTISPQDFAAYAMAMCHLFKDKDGNPGMLIWEENGPGMEFSKRIKEDGFRRVFMRETETDFYRRKSQKAGWYSRPETKRVLLSAYKEALMRREFWNPCAEALKECGEYVHRPGGGAIEHARTSNAIDPTATGENHGDMVIADALCNRGIRDRGGPEGQVTTEATLPPTSYKFRRLEWERSQVKTNRY